MIEAGITAREIDMTSKERAAFKTQAMQLDSIFQIGKSSLTPQMVDAIRDALKARELIKISVLKNCLDDPREIAQVLSERTGSEVVQVIGKKIVLYKKNYELEEKRKRAAKRKTGTARNAVIKGKAKQDGGKTGTAKNAVARNAVAKGTARQNSKRTRTVKSTTRQDSDRTGMTTRTGHSGRPAAGKQMKWSDS